MFKLTILDPSTLRESTFPKQALVFTCLQHKLFENTVGKIEIARNEQSLLFPQCFYPFGEIMSFHQIQECRLINLPVWKSLKFVLGKGLIEMIYKS